MQQQTSKQLSGPEDGVEVKSASNVRHMVPSKDLIIAAEKEYEKIKAAAEKQEKLASNDDPLLIKLENILAEFNLMLLCGTLMLSMGLGSDFN